MTIQLLNAGLGTYTEPGTDVVWVRDRYTEPREADFDCCECQQPITEWEFWTCLDGGEAAHEGCVTTEHACEPKPGSVFDANNLWVTTAEQAAGKGRYPLRAVCRTCELTITRDKDKDWQCTL